MSWKGCRGNAFTACRIQVVQNEWCMVCPCAPSLPVKLPFCQAHVHQLLSLQATQVVPSQPPQHRPEAMQTLHLTAGIRGDFLSALGYSSLYAAGGRPHYAKSRCKGSLVAGARLSFASSTFWLVIWKLPGRCPHWLDDSTPLSQGPEMAPSRAVAELQNPLQKS